MWYAGSVMCSRFQCFSSWLLWPAHRRRVWYLNGDVTQAHIKQNQLPVCVSAKLQNKINSTYFVIQTKHIWHSTMRQAGFKYYETAHLRSGSPRPVWKSTFSIFIEIHIQTRFTHIPWNRSLSISTPEIIYFFIDLQTVFFCLNYKVRHNDTSWKWYLNGHIFLIRYFNRYLWQRL